MVQRIPKMVTGLSACRVHWGGLLTFSLLGLLLLTMLSALAARPEALPAAQRLAWWPGPGWTHTLGSTSFFLPGDSERKRPIVVLDAGHGGSDPGAMAASGLTEKVVTLEAARKLEAVLQAQGWQVLMTRTSDREVRPDASNAKELGARVALSDAPRVAVFVSLHCDASSCESARGTTLHWNKAIDRPLARALAGDLAIPPDSVERSPLYVLRHTHMPAVLIELGYLSNPEEARLLSQDDYRTRLVTRIGNSLTRWQAERDGTAVSLEMATDPTVR